MTELTSGDGSIAEVREGMRVVDVDGKALGRVQEIRMPDPGAVTARGQGTAGDDGLLVHLAHVAVAFGGGSVPRGQAQERLARLGYVRVDACGVSSGDRYVAGDEIVSVTAETVHLNVPIDMVLG